MNDTGVETGLARLLPPAPALGRAGIGLLTHPAAVTPSLVPAVDLMARSGLDVVAVFGPQHGARGEKQDNMIESDSYTDPGTGVPVYSLYGETRKPTPEMLEGIGTLIVDLQDVGVRVYTFIWTMTLVMEACRDAGVRCVVLDRPNPIGGVVREGALLRQGFESFVGRLAIPLRHGLTIGEVARLANDHLGIGCDLEVVTLKGWTRDLWFDQTGLPYVMPSPNLPTLDSCTVYPGMVLMEGTNLSEGRGTTRPFELFGAPFLRPDEVTRHLARHALAGVVFRPCFFEPTFQKHAGMLCGGAQMHITDRNAFRPVKTAVTILRVVRDLARDDFEWRAPPYEYEFEKRPIDILWGNEMLRVGLDAGADPEEILRRVDGEVADFSEVVKPYLLY